MRFDVRLVLINMSHSNYRIKYSNVIAKTRVEREKRPLEVQAFGGKVFNPLF